MDNWTTTSLRWRHNGRDSISNHQPHDCLLNRLFRRRSKKTSKLRETCLEYPAQMASNAENVSIWWRHHVVRLTKVNHRNRSRCHDAIIVHWVWHQKLELKNNLNDQRSYEFGVYILRQQIVAKFQNIVNWADDNQSNTIVQSVSGRHILGWCFLWSSKSFTLPQPANHFFIKLNLLRVINTEISHACCSLCW